MTQNVLVLAQEETDTQPMPVRARLGFHSVFHRLWKVAIPTSLERNGPNRTTPFPTLQTLFPQKIRLTLGRHSFHIFDSGLHTKSGDGFERNHAFLQGHHRFRFRGGSESPRTPKKVSTEELICAVFVGLTELKRVLTAPASSGDTGLWSVQGDSGINEGF